MRPLRSVLEAVSRGDARGDLAERVAALLREQLPEDHVVLARYAPRDRGARVALVVIGRDRLFVVEPRDEDGDLVCYQDHWYRRSGPNAAHPLADPPSLRARRNAERIRGDLGTGGFLNVRIEPLVVLTRGRPDDVRSSCAPVIAGVDALVRYMRRAALGDAAPERTHALASALAKNITLATN
jgi:hypothetical protein